jgi:predicted enzyme related to lactoylglutathione lyase
MADAPSLALVVLAVPDLPAALRFYRAAFDWPQTVDAPVYAELSLPAGMRLGLYLREGFARNAGSLPHRIPNGALAPTELYLLVPDVSAALARVAAAGGRILAAAAPRDWGEVVGYAADPAGNVLALARASPPA